MSAAAPNLRWLVFGLGAAAFSLSFFHRVAPAAIATELTRAFEMSGAALGALAATYFYVYAVMQLPTGVLADTLGPRRVLAAGSLVAGVGSIMFGSADSVVLAAAGRTLVGLGVSVAFISLLKLTANWFEERRFATVSGFANVIGLGGALAAAAPLAWLITVVSWRSVFMGIGALSFVIAVLTWIMVRDHPYATGATTRLPGTARGQWYHGLAEVVRNRATWPAFWVTFGMSGSYVSFVGLWLVPFLVHAHGLSPLEASRHTTVMLIALAVSTAGIAVLSDRMRRRRAPMIASGALYLLCWAAWMAGAGAASGTTYVLSIVMGVSAAGFTLSWACAKEVNRPQYAGMATSLANIGGFLAAGVLQPLVGWVLDRTAGHFYMAGDFRYALGVLMLFAASGFLGALFIRETHCRNIWVENKR
ncbi:MAG: hypothetical protein A3G24_15740 [Betaproteobacteria bacterium RIFCSPLOWO2_12_FULL_62_13]|nr:MAG: hypothetical protein A3G24_15740 [Betaproteobacteria bacterium RIFCSPLOWO2_12_FULL_62_13]